MDLLKGKISFYDKKVQKVLIEWKKLIDGEFYNDDNSAYTWEGVLPRFYRNKIAFLLVGNFVNSRWPDSPSLMQDIAFMPFPRIAKNIPYYENAPTDVFFIPRQTKKLKEAKTFLRYIARADVQSSLNERLGYVPPNNEAKIGQNRFIMAGQKILKGAEGLGQYFDRDTTPEFDKIATPLMAGIFLNTGDIKEITRKLEDARKKVFLSGKSSQDTD